MRAPRTAPPVTSLPRASRLDAAEAPRPIWLWRGAGPALTPRGLVPLDIEGAAPAVMTPSGPGLRIERGTTNFVTNPSFEVDLAGWAAVAGASISRETTGGGASGDAYARVAVSATGHGIRFAGTGNAAQGQPYAASMYLRAATTSDAGKTVQVYLDAPGSAYEIFATDHVLTDAWARVVLPAVWAQAGHLTWSIVARDAIGQGGFTFLADAVQYETGSCSSYADGTMGSGFSWTGTAHGSVSVRQPSSISTTVPGVRPDRGTLSLWCRPDWSSPAGGERVLLDCACGNVELRLTADPSGTWRLTSRADFIEDFTEVAQSHQASDRVQLIATWSPTDLMLCLGNAMERRAHTTPALGIDVAKISMGHSLAGEAHFAGVVGNLSLWGRQFRQSEITAITRGGNVSFG